MRGNDGAGREVPIGKAKAGKSLNSEPRGRRQKK